MQKPSLPPKKHPKRKLISVLVILLVVAGYIGFALTRPLAALTPRKPTGSLQITTPTPNLPWQDAQEGAIGYVGGGLIAEHDDQTPVATASTAKLLTVLTVLQKHPLAANQSGPTITLDATDVAYYNNYVSEGGSVATVTAGEQISERQVIEAMLLPSANNLADSLARWAYGSLSAYTTAGNAFALQNGLSHTTVGSDASGFDPSTTSTAGDLVKLGILAMQNPAIAQIVAEPSATIPVSGTITNRNILLGTDGIIGIKTGNNDADPGVFIGAAEADVNGMNITVIAADANAGSLSGAFDATKTLLDATRSDFTKTTLVHSGSVLGTYSLPWGGSVQAVASQDLSITIFQGATAHTNFTLRQITAKAKSGQTIGTLTTPTASFNTAQSVPIVLAQSPTKPSLTWRLVHAF